MSRYCPTCNRFVEEADDKCARCGFELPTHDVAEHFVSGPPRQRMSSVDLAPGTSLDRFTIERRLGGRNGTAVYLARDTLRSEQVALKVIEVGPCTSDVAALQLQHEMRLHERIADRRYVVRVHDMHFVPTGGSGLLLLSMEYAEGGTFRQWLLEHRDNPELRRSEGLRHFKGICCGVGAMHEAGIIHQDLKPENFLFVNGVLKVSDFGVARTVETLRATTGSGWDEFPACPGTAVYMSPEQFLAPHPDDLDVRSDIYALGGILFEIVHPNCRPPFGGSYERLRELHTHAPPPPLHGATDAEAHVVARCLDKNPANRYPDVWDLLDDLEREGDFMTPPQTDEQEDSRQHLEQLWGKAQVLVAEKDMSEAAGCCRELIEAWPDHAGAKRLLEEIHTCSEQVRQMYAAVERDIERRGLKELSMQVQQAMTLYPKHPAGHPVRARLGARAAEYRRCMVDGVQAVRNGLWDTAVGCFQQAQRLDPGSTAVLSAIEFVSSVQARIGELRGYIDKAVREHNRPRALHLARLLDRYNDVMRGRGNGVAG